MIHAPLTPWKHGEPIDAWLYPELQVKLAELMDQHEVRTVLEIGSCYGCSAIWFAQRVGLLGLVGCVDTWDDIPEHGLYNVASAFRENVRDAGMGKAIIPCRGNSHDKRVRDSFALAGRYDLVYLDGDHTYEGVKQDIEMYGPLARKVLCGDDYDVDLPSVAGVIRAVDELVPGRQTVGRFWWTDKI